MAFQLPNLPYGFDALEPHVDARTMEIHQGKHHAAYTNNLNAAIQGTDMETLSIEAILGKISTRPMAVRNNGGGFYNHNLFWTILSPDGAPQPESGMKIHDAIVQDLGSYEDFKKAFSTAATTRFGSGWAWLVIRPDGELAVTSSANQDNPLMNLRGTLRGTPLLGLDVWEHAYYLTYQNRRADYIEACWSLVNWNELNRRYAAASTGGLG